VTRLLAAGLLTSLLAAPALAENWPQWRGPKNDGHSAETGLSAEWGPEKNVVWKCKMPGRGSSTPCIWDDKIFLTAMEETQPVLFCVGTDGQEKWKRPMGPKGRTTYQGRGGEGDDASASCSTDGKHLWALVGTGECGCFDFTGNPVWEFDAQERYGKYRIQWGPHWSPLLYKDRLYLQLYHHGGQHLIALDKMTGKEVWHIERKGAGRGESPDSYTTPAIWAGEGGPLLISHGNDYTTAHKLDDGSEVWRVEGLNPSNNGAWRFVSTPLVTPDLIVVPSCKNGPTVGFNPVGAKGAINPDNPAELWRLPNLTPDVPSPLRDGNEVYLVGAGGTLTALDAKTGKRHYDQPLARQIHRASPVSADGKIIVVGLDGAMNVVKAGPKFERIAASSLPDKFYASPAVSGGRIYFRGWNYLWAIGTK
jgi:outer membrane protein assembly factor BamB